MKTALIARAGRRTHFVLCPTTPETNVESYVIEGFGGSSDEERGAERGRLDCGAGDRGTSSAGQALNQSKPYP